jgi:hypothetical protein
MVVQRLWVLSISVPICPFPVFAAQTQRVLLLIFLNALNVDNCYVLFFRVSYRGH